MCLFAKISLYECYMLLAGDISFFLWMWASALCTGFYMAENEYV